MIVTFGDLTSPIHHITEHGHLTPTPLQQSPHETWDFPCLFRIGGVKGTHDHRVASPMRRVRSEALTDETVLG